MIPHKYDTAFAEYRLDAVRAFTAPALELLHGESMGTGWSVKYWGDVATLPPQSRVLETIEHALRQVVAQMSTWDPGSTLSRFNSGPAGSRHAVPEEMAQVLECATALAKLTNGAFDPTVGPLVNLWGFGPRDRSHDGARQIPTTAQIEETRKRCGHAKLQWHREEGLTQPGYLYLDLSAIAKGFAVDLVAARLREMGIENALVEIGGELSASGTRPSGAPWRVAVAMPRCGTDASQVPLLDLALHSQSIATSGDHWHYFAQSGKEFAHTIDPRSGLPVTHNLASVTVVHESCMHADALATVLTVMGPDEGFDFAQRENLAALFVRRADSGCEERMTQCFAALLDRSDSDAS